MVQTNAADYTSPAGWLSRAEMCALVARIKPRPGWTLRVDGGGRFVMQATVENSRYEADPVNEKRTVGLFMPRVPPPEALTGGAARFYAWALYEYLWLAMHEEMEWFRDVETLQPILDPHDSERTATRLLPPRPGEEWWTDDLS